MKTVADTQRGRRGETECYRARGNTHVLARLPTV